MYLMMAVIGFAFLPLAMFSREWAFRTVHIYCNWVRWTASWMVGLRSEVRGEVPTDEVLIASKHQSFFDIIILVSVVPRPKFIMKQQLRWAPVLSWYARMIGCIFVDRGKRGAAIKKMVSDVKRSGNEPGQLIIYPQGTRVAPGAQRPFKVGTGVLYSQLEQDCVLAATNVGVFWPRHGIYRKPGLAVVEFLPRLKAGMPQDVFMRKLQDVIEENSNRLMAEAGFTV
jgi:1-acyl-sn-glycerol-3-phosphate acyltransferase